MPWSPTAADDVVVNDEPLSPRDVFTLSTT